MLYGQYKWLKFKFDIDSKKSKPVEWPPIGPWWQIEEKNKRTTIVAYIPKGTDVGKYWPEAKNVDIVEVCDKITFSKKLPKPDWWK